MKIINHSEVLIKEIADLKKIKINFIPTMGNLHKGHESLILKAKESGFYNIVSVFVNPLQFNDENDYIRYPRTKENDLKILKKLKVNLIFFPEKNFITEKFFPGKIQFLSKLCGIDRPGHFEGVASVIFRFLNLLKPDFIYLGEKDYQQILVIKSLIKNLEFKTKVVEIPTVRESNGLDLSSRNKLISIKKKKITEEIFKALKNISNEINNQGLKKSRLLYFKRRLLKLGFDKVNYFKILNSDDLNEISSESCRARIFISIELDSIRLIDNLVITRKVRMIDKKYISS